ncbi:MAG: acylneuraminate cytidylyltransferase family protein [bacterium]|nr:acylneuraminate cytidylyltransferase family protein [bacterium]
MKRKNNKNQHTQVQVLAVIPARGGSKSIPHKNIAQVGGKPLIYYTIREANRAKRLDAVIVSTDDPVIAEVARSYGADVPFLRPKKYAGDHSRDIEFLRHAVLWVEKHRGWKPEIVIFLQPTSPTRTGADIDAVIDFMEREQCDSVRTVVPPPYHPLKMMVVTDGKKQRIVPIISIVPSLRRLGADVPRQLLPTAVQPVGLVYATRTHFIKKGRVWGDDVRAFFMPREKLTDIDTVEDLISAGDTLRSLGLLDP